MSFFLRAHFCLLISSHYFLYSFMPHMNTLYLYTPHLCHYEGSRSIAEMFDFNPLH